MRGCLIVLAVGCNFTAGEVHDTGDAPNIMFVTSNTVVAAMLGGLDGADRFCQTSAHDAKLPGTYRAWLSTTTTNARDRLTGASGWVRVDGKPFVDTVDDLVAGRMFYPPRLDENGGDDPTGAFQVATGTAGNGGRSSETCDDYTAQVGSVTIGKADGTTERWTNANAALGCAGAVHLYCFGIDRAAHVTVTPASGKRAFVTDASFGLGGVLGADQLCQTEAAPLSGTFVAAIATSTEPASSRIGSAPLVRLDGVAIGTLDAPLAPLNVTPARHYVTSRVWTGAPTPEELGSDASTCKDWTSSALSGTAGDVARSNAVSFDDGAQPCANQASLYCLEQ